MVIYLTDVPLVIGNRLLVASARPESHVGVIAVPALGVARRRRVAHDAVAVLVDELAPRRTSLLERLPSRRLLDRLMPVRRTTAEEDEEELEVRYVMPLGLGHLRLLAGMVRANRPWRTVVALSHALAAALGTAALAILNSTVWQLAGALSWPRLLAIMATSVGLLVAWLVIRHDLWERRREGIPLREPALYNVVTVLTLVIAVLCAYAVLLVLLVISAEIVVEARVLRQALGRPIDLRDYLSLAWLAASIATVAGALGSGLDNVEEVRAAAYGHNQRRRGRCRDAEG